MPVFGEDGFGVKLHTVHGQRLVAHTHNFAVVRPGCYFKALRQRLALDDQRMIACCGERIGQSAEYAVAVVVNLRSLAVHQRLGVNDLAAKSLSNALVAEANAEQRDFTGEVLDRGNRNTGFVRRTGAGRDDKVLRIQFFDLLHGDFIVAVYQHFFAEFGEILHQVIGKGVVIVDHQQHVGFLA